MIYTHSLLEAREVNGKGTLILTRAKCCHGNVGDCRKNYDTTKPPHKHCHKKVAQSS